MVVGGDDHGAGEDLVEQMQASAKTVRSLEGRSDRRRLESRLIMSRADRLEIPSATCRVAMANVCRCCRRQECTNAGVAIFDSQQ